LRDRSEELIGERSGAVEQEVHTNEKTVTAQADDDHTDSGHEGSLTKKDTAALKKDDPPSPHTRKRSCQVADTGRC
jgi:hypothetical protein